MGNPNNNGHGVHKWLLLYVNIGWCELDSTDKSIVNFVPNPLGPPLVYMPQNP